MKLRAAVSAFLFFAATYFAPHANAQAAPEKNKIICDHAAPPRGMHYVCKSQCDCHLEGTLKNDEDRIAPLPVPTSEMSEPKVCKYDAPKPGELLICDSDCKCGPQTKVDQNQSASSCRQAATVMVPATYPSVARINLITGVVFVQVEVNDDGTVKTANPVEGHPMLAQAAKDAVSKWHFDPLCSRVQMVTVRFRITTDETNDPPGYQIHPPDEIEVVALAPEINTSAAKVVKNRKSKPVKKKPSK